MVQIENSNFSIQQICQSGQCFRMDELECCDGQQRVRLVANGRYLEISQAGNKICFDCTQKDYDSTWKNYFDMDTDYAAIIGSIDPADSYLMAAAAFGKGIRILQQDLWEMIISFIISQQNNIKRIKKCINVLCEKYGEQKKTEAGIIYYDFPTPQALANAAIDDLYACKLGYRSRYIYNTANSVWQGEFPLENLPAMEYAVARSELLKLCGVGEKVADCICLFALHKTEAFPKDIHINKVLAAQYPNGFPFKRYDYYSGILQQYIFYYDLKEESV